MIPGGFFWMSESSAPEEERSGVDASAVRKQSVEYGGLPSHMEGGQHQPSARQPRLVADSVCQRRLQRNHKWLMIREVKTNWQQDAEC